MLSAERIEVGRVHAVCHGWACGSRNVEGAILRLYLLVNSVERISCGRRSRCAVALLRLI